MENSSAFDGMASTTLKRAVFVVLPMMLFAMLLAASPARADYTHTYIEVTNELDRTILAEVTQYDTYYGESQYQSKHLAPGESHVFYFQPTAWFMWEATYEYTIKAGAVELLYELRNKWGIGPDAVGPGIMGFRKITRENTSYSAYVTHDNTLLLRGTASTRIHILR